MYTDAGHVFAISRQWTAILYESLHKVMTEQGKCDSDSDTDEEGYVTPSEVRFADDEEVPSPEKGSHQVAPELQQRIIDQVEWYFSDENLLKDSFLMKHIRRNKQGLVSLKLVASFRKVKSLTKDWRVVQASLLQSSQLELSDDRNKVRRVSAIPEVDYSHILRTVIVLNYPGPQPRSEDIEREFSQYGEVTLVRILHPGMAIPVDVRPSRKRHPAIGKTLCILVEFESQGGAVRACKKFNHQQSWRNQLSVMLLSNKDDREDAEGQSHFLSTVKSAGHRNAHDPRLPVKNKRKVKGSPAVSHKFLSPDNSREKEYLSDSGCSVRRARSPRLSPEPIRKFPSDQSLTQSRRSVHESRLIRQPWGPNGSRGFVRTKPIVVPIVC